MSYQNGFVPVQQQLNHTTFPQSQPQPGFGHATSYPTKPPGFDPVEEGKKKKKIIGGLVLLTVTFIVLGLIGRILPHLL